MSPTLLDLDVVRRYLRQRLLVSVPTRERVVALTFDDGPSPVNTPPLLDLLAERGAHASFFLVGRRCRDHGKLVERIAEEGHELGNHGFHHLPMNLLPSRWMDREILQTEKLIREHAGARPHYFRPPFGWFSDRLLERVDALGYQPVIGSIHPRDSKQPRVRTIVDRVRRRMQPGAVIILHDGGWREMAGRGRTLDAVEILVDELQGEGYRFLTLTGLLEHAVSAAEVEGPPENVD